MKVLVHEAKPHDAIGMIQILDSIAEAFRQFGFDVFRWASCSDQSFPASVHFDLAVIWKGFQNWFPQVKAHLLNQGTRILYVDVDYFGYWEIEKPEEAKSFYLQFSNSKGLGGVGGFASWSDFPLHSKGDPVKVGDGDLLVALQSEGLYRVKCISPHFSSCFEFIRHLIEYSVVPLRFRKHPAYEMSVEIDTIVGNAPNAYWDENKYFLDSLENGCCAVASVDSHAAIKAIQRNVPVLSYGQSIYRKEGVSWICDTEEDTVKYTMMLKNKECALDVAKQHEFIEFLRSKTWKTSELPGRLSRFLRWEGYDVDVIE